MQEELEKCVNKLFNSEEEEKKDEGPTVEDRLKVLEDDHVTKDKFEALKKNSATGNDLRQSLAKLESNVTQKLTKELGRISVNEKAISEFEAQLKIIEETLSTKVKQDSVDSLSKRLDSVLKEVNETVENMQEGLSGLGEV